MKNSLLQKDYGFVRQDQLPAGAFVGNCLSGIERKWAVTGDFMDLARNHCGATVVTNLALYFADHGCPRLRQGDDRATFQAVHRFAGDGPISFLAPRAVRYFRSCGVSLKTTPVWNRFAYQREIALGHPCIFLLVNAPYSGHFVIGVGWRQYADGSFWIQIQDSWHRDAHRWFHLLHGAVPMSLFSCQIMLQ